jgi:hypothetical protein
MYQGQIDVISNRADWTAPMFVQLVDDSDDSIIDITNVDIDFDCAVYIKDADNCHIVTGTIDSGEVIVSDGDDGPGFQWAFEASRLYCLCAGTYKFGIKTTANGDVQDLVIGTVAVVEGN